MITVRFKLISFASLLFLQQLPACKLQNEQSTAKFTALKTDFFLMRDVHKNKLNIMYGFEDNNGCNGQFKGERKKQLTATVSELLRIWLSPLKDKGNIVDRFDYHEKTVYYQFGGRGSSDKSKILTPRKLMLDRSLLDKEKTDLQIIFYCSVNIGEFHFDRIKLKPNSIHVGLSGDLQRTKYTLLHELGHAFGLGDTYAGIFNANKDGGITGTRKGQPESVMSAYYSDQPEPELRLGANDRNGIRWLYRLHVEKSVDKKDCPVDYIPSNASFDSLTRGCVPAYPLIFIIKEGDKFLQHNTLILSYWHHLHERDSHGNTALHYAAKRANSKDGKELYDILISYGADPTSRNHAGQTPADLLATSISPLPNAGNPVNHAPNTLIVAVSNEHVEMVKKLLTQGNTDINKRDELGNTALHIAVIYGNVEIAKLLLAHKGIDLTVTNVEGVTAHQLAISNGNRDILSLFE